MDKHWANLLIERDTEHRSARRDGDPITYPPETPHHPEYPGDVYVNHEWHCQYTRGCTWVGD